MNTLKDVKVGYKATIIKLHGEGAVKRRYYKIRDSFKKYYEREQREKEV